MTDKLWTMKAIEAHSLLKRKEVSAKELLEISISRIVEVDKDLNALPEKCFGRARRIAINIDNNQSKNRNNLLGLPIAVKDYNDLAGVKTTYGSPIFRDNIPISSDRTIETLERFQKLISKNNYWVN